MINNNAYNVVSSNDIPDREFVGLKEISKRSNLELKLVQTATKLLETKKLVMRKTNVNP